MHLIVCSYHATYAFQSESKLYSCMNVKELLAQTRHEVSILSNSNWIRINKHLVHKRTLNHLAKFPKWLSCVVSTYLYNAFDCIFISCHVRVSELIYTLQLAKCQGTPCLKEAKNMKFKWLQMDFNAQPLSSYTNTQPIIQYDKLLGCVVSTYQYALFNCMFLSCHLHVSE